jgi:Ca2+-binding RTX toxin-like protein
VLLSANANSLLATADSVEIFTNSGEITGDLDFGSGNDTYTNFASIKTKTKTTTVNGSVDGSIFMGEGNDIFKGGGLHERVVDGGGKDAYTLGGGDDVFTSNGTNAGDGNVDTVDGGPGIDQYDAFSLGATANLRINLDTIAHFDSIFGFTLAANTATDVGAGETGTDVVKNFENVISGSGNDSIFGSAVKNVFNGAEGDDTMFGLGGNDNLLGGSGADDLFGGSGRDHLDGGGSDGAIDTFHYSKLTDSLPGLKNRDFIGFFEDGFDRIDLSDVIVGNVTLTAVNSTFGADLNEIRILTIGGGWVIQFDNGDNKPDLAIEVDDLTHSIVWDVNDFVV